MSSAASQHQPSPPSAISEALSLDLQVLTLLLRRNSAAHHRARYYRRLQMMIRSLERYGLHDASASFYGNILSPIRTEVEWIQSMADRDRQKRARGVEDKWTTRTALAASATKRKGSRQGDDHEAMDSYETNRETSLFASRVMHLTQKMTHHVPEVLSRILYAAEGLYTELSRGYFVPFCTAALAAISRIRALLMRMGREGCIDLGRCLTTIDNVLEVHGGKAIDGELWHDKLDLLRLKGLLKKIRHDNDLGKEILWGDWTNQLMDSFVEIDPQQHEKEQQERRRQGAIRRGISDISASSASKMSQKNTGDAKLEGIDEASDDDKDSNDDIQRQSSEGGGDNDLGECVDIGQNDDDLVLARSDIATKKDKKRKAASFYSVDVNEQILQMMKEKSRPKSTTKEGDGADLGGKDKPKKKKRKKERLEQSTKASSIDDIFGDLDDDGEGSSMPQGTNKEKKKSKKAKKEKKKKSSKRNAVDDIFDGL